MKLRDVALQLLLRVPFLTDKFSDVVDVTSAVHSGTTATISTTTSHGLKIGDTVLVNGAFTPITISSLVHSASSGIAVVTTAIDHDLTLFSVEEDDTNFQVILSGFVESEFNGTFELLDVISRREFHFEVDTTAPASGSGTPILENGVNYQRILRGPYAVATVPSKTQITVEHTLGTSLGTLGGTITLRANTRITAAISFERAQQAYGAQYDVDAETLKDPKAWAYVVLNDQDANRGREHRSDEHDIQRAQGAWLQILIQPVSVFVALPASNQTLADNVRDEAEDLLGVMLGSLLAAPMPTGVVKGKSGELNYVSDGFASYDGATYWHEFVFQQRAEIEYGDTVGPDQHVAFRDFEYTMTPELNAPQGDGEMTGSIDLDKIPI